MSLISSIKLANDLRDYQAIDGLDGSHLRSTRNFLQNTREPFSRTNFHGHVTASAWIVDRELTRALLIHHRQMQRWLQPGGHVEAADADLATAARREAEEETGITGHFAAISPSVPFDVDVHRIPASKIAPAHWHFDVRYLFIADSSVVRSSNGVEECCRWFALGDIAHLQIDDGLSRLVRKTLALANPYGAGVRFI